MGDLTKNFSRHEFACHDGTPWPTEEEEALQRIAKTCQIIRDEWALLSSDPRVTVVSAFRPSWYKRQDLKPTSQHAERSELKDTPPCAVDLQPVDITCASSAAFYSMIRRLMDEGKIPKGGLGRYPGSFTHVDDRCFWGYRAAKWGARV